VSTPVEAPWTGGWVAARLGVDLADAERAGAAPSGDLAARDLVGLAVRRNPRRAHLLVSRVLGKHVPTDPRLVRAAGALLGQRVRAVLDGAVPEVGPRTVPGLVRALAGDREAAAVLRDAATSPTVSTPTVFPPPCVVLGFAETATGLGHVVADALDAEHYLHSTRRGDPARSFGGFVEEHSHAADHLLLPREPAALEPDVPLVLVDDELSTGRTAAATVRALHARAPRGRYLVAALVDVRDPAAVDELAALARELRVRVDVVALARGVVAVPDDVLDRGRRLVAALDRPATGPAPSDRSAPAAPPPVRLAEMDGVVEGGRHGLNRHDRRALEALLPELVARIVDAVGPAQGRVVVLGTEELMYLPLRLAEGLADRGVGTVDFSSTTRSPVLPVDDPAYAIRSAVRFPAHDAGGRERGPRFAYNLGPSAVDPGYDTIVLVVDAPASTPALHAPDGLLARLRERAATVVEVVVPVTEPPVPRPPLRGPAFGSYRPEEVGWLLTDLSGVPLEAPNAEREQAIRAGTAHYAESLPIEYRPSAAYEQLFRAALARTAARLAAAVGRVTDHVLATRGRPGTPPVLVSLARAGTPVGILMRRWAAAVRGVELAHYAVSIVRDRGIDEAALDALAAWHDPSDAVFVDGWTGKGAIARELTAALTAYRASYGVAFDDTLAVLADPGHCTTVRGTREDYLIPSACLNSTVSGLVSRTVLRPDLLAPGGYHGAQSYAHLAASDVSAAFLDAVTAEFGVPGPVPPAGPPGEPPDWRGMRFVRALGEYLGVGNLHLLKPGVGETTRVLLRRAPDTVLMARDGGEDVEHVRMLCRDRAVPIRELPREVGGVPSPYVCVGVIDGGRR